VAHLPAVLPGICPPDELKDWPIDAWALPDCTDQERQRRLGQNAGTQRLAEGIRDGREYRQLGLPVIDTTGRAPATVASELAVLIQSLRQSQES
jgi:hypothetical protein